MGGGQHDKKKKTATRSPTEHDKTVSAHTALVGVTHTHTHTHTHTPHTHTHTHIPVCIAITTSNTMDFGELTLGSLVFPPLIHVVVA